MLAAAFFGGRANKVKMRSIQAKELRLGQYYNVPKDGQCPFRVDMIDYASKGVGKVGQIHDPKLHPLTWYLQDLKPIPITEKWAKSFGFKLETDLGDQKFYEHEKAPKIQLVFDHDDIALHYIVGDGYTCIFYDDPNFLFVHQLQDYFFVNGVELVMS